MKPFNNFSNKMQTEPNYDYDDNNIISIKMRKLFPKVPKSLLEAKAMIYECKTDFFSKGEQFCFMESADSIKQNPSSDPITTNGPEAFH